MTVGETLVFIRDTRVFECTLCFRVAELIGFERDELHWEAFWSVRVDGILFGSLPLQDFQERASEVELRVVHWYRSERIRRTSREV
ncbi:MAG TPA: hypothetical protein VH539_20110 [Gemmatimonadaceae bacterium]